MNGLYRKVYQIFYFCYTVCGKTIIQFVAKPLYNLWYFYYTICGFASYGSVSCLIERQIEATLLRSACTVLGW